MCKGASSPYHEVLGLELVSLDHVVDLVTLMETRPLGGLHHHGPILLTGSALPVVPVASPVAPAGDFSVFCRRAGGTAGGSAVAPVDGWR